VSAWQDDKVSGWITSGGCCHHAEKSLAIGYVPTEVLGNGADTAKWQIEILGEMRAARLQLEALFDPKAERMRG
jgi:dimethylglycine dehydrogenase